MLSFPQTVVSGSTTMEMIPSRTIGMTMATGMTTGRMTAFAFAVGASRDATGLIKNKGLVLVLEWMHRDASYGDLHPMYVVFLLREHSVRKKT